MVHSGNPAKTATSRACPCLESDLLWMLLALRCQILGPTQRCFGRTMGPSMSSKHIQVSIILFWALQFECGLSLCVRAHGPQVVLLCVETVDSLEDRDKLEKVCSSRSQGSQPSFLFALYFMVCKIVRSLSSTNPTMTDRTLSNHEPQANNKKHPLKLLLAS